MTSTEKDFIKMLIIYFLLGLGLTTAHSDYGVSFRAQNFEETLQNIDKQALRNHQRERRFVTGYFVPQNATNRHTWGSNSSREYVANVTRLQHKNNATRPYDTIIYPGQPGFVAPSKNTSGDIIFARTKGTNNVTPQYYVNPEQNSNVTRPGYTNYNNIDVKPGYNNNFSNTSDSSGLIVKPVNSVTPGYIPYPGYPTPNTVYPAPYFGNLAPNNGYPVPSSGYPVPNNGYPIYPAPNNINPVPTNGYTIPSSGYPVPNTVYPVPNTVYPMPNTVYLIPINGYPVPNTGNPVPNNGYPVAINGYPVPNTGYPVPNSGNPVPNNGYPVPNNGYPVPNAGNPVPNSGYTVPNYGYPIPNNGYPVPNHVYPVPNNATQVPSNPFPGFKPPSGFNNTGSGTFNTGNLKNCKCDRVRGNSTITKEEISMDACMISCNDCPDGMKMSAFGICVRDDNDEDY